MTATEASDFSSPSVLSNGDPISPEWEGHTVRLASHRLKSSVAVVVVQGDIDAFNADIVTAYTLRHLSRHGRLILDLSRVNFFGAEGFTTLLRVSVSCAQLDTDWAILSSTGVSRVLGICDPERSLPVAETLTAALAAFADQRNPRPRLITASKAAAG